MLELRNRQWEIILQGLAGRRDMLTEKLNEPGDKFHMEDTWKRTREACQEAIDKICAEYPEAVDLYYSDCSDSAVQLDRNF